MLAFRNDTGDGELDWLEQGEELTILDTNDDWIQVQTQPGDTGWVKGKYCGGQP